MAHSSSSSWSSWGALKRRLRPRALVALVFAAVLLLPLQPGAPMQAAASTSLPPGGKPTISTASDGALGKVDPQLLQEARGATASGRVGVIVVTDGPLADARGMTRQVTRKPDDTGLTFTEGQVEPAAIPALAGAPNVVAVLSNTPPQVSPLPEPAYERTGQTGKAARGTGPRAHPPGSPLYNQPAQQQQAAGQEAVSPDSWHALDIHHVRDAWAQGYRGQGVTTALIDSGVDFAHPDLQGTFARVQDRSSPYYGWPYVVDPYSMELLSLGVAHNVPEAITGYGSWYVETSTTVSGQQAEFTTVTATASGMNPITHTYTLPGTSKSGVYHIGIHPDEHLAFDVYQEYPAVLVADTVSPGVYDTVYVDLNGDHDFRDDSPLSKGHEIAGLDTNGDGLADLSSGLLYFIADGRTPIPASDWLFGLLPPEKGSLVALFGSFDYNEDHGTFCASSIVAQGVVDGNTPLRPPYKPQGVGGMVQGTAPETKLVAIGNVYRSNMAIYNGMLIAALGLDGRPGTGDEPQIASMSFGYSGGWNNGWDFMSRYLLYLSRFNPQLAWLAATGNGGPGYGTVTPPATSPAAIAVGAATQYGETTTFDPISSTERITWGDVQPWSNRGPSHLGQPRPDFVAVGAWGTGDVPLNMARDGGTAYDIWGGTSMATPVGAGITALVYQAYRAAHGTWPTAETARSILASSAQDLNYGVFTQGAGMLDAARAVALASERGGVSVSPTMWTPGQTAPGFSGTLAPGESASRNLQLTNHGSSPVQAHVYAEQLVQTSEYEWSVPISNAQESRADFVRPDYLWNLTSHIPVGTDLVRVSAVVSYTDFSLSNPRMPFLGPLSAWRVLAYDWHDDNRDGLAYADRNRNGVVNDGEYQRGELNRLTYGYNMHDEVSLSVERPLERSHDGLIVGLQHQVSSNLVPTSTVHLKLTTYRKQAWPLVSTPAGKIAVAPGQTVPVSASAQVPAGTPAGAYEGSIVVEVEPGTPGSQRTIVPVALNVRAPSLPASLGGANRPPSGTLFDNGRVTGEQNWNWRADSGEWRHFYFDNNTQPPPNTFLWAGLQWANFPTDIDMTIGGPAPWDWFSQRDPSLFGPSGLGGIASSEWMNLGGGAWQWRTASDSTEEWVSGRLGQTGTHEAVLHNVFYSGLADSEAFTGTLGTVRLSNDSLNITSSGSQGSTTLTMTTDVDLPGVRAAAFGLSQKQTWHNIEIEPLHTWFTDTTFSDLASIEFSTEAPDGTNIDMYIDHWENGRYVWVAASTSPTGNEYVRIDPAQPGNYRVRIDAARDVPDPAHFDFSINAVGGTDMNVSPSELNQPIPAGTTLTFTVGYNRPGIPDGVWEGRLFLGPYNAPTLMSLPVTVYKGTITPTPTPTPRVCRNPFTDVPPDYWAYGYIDDLYCRGVVSGYLDNTFRPGGYASRMQFAKMLVLGMGWPLEHPAKPSFVDVPEFSWGYEYVETARAHAAIAGYDDGTFRPSAPVTRGQLAKMLVLGMGWPLEDPPKASFTDVPRGSAFFQYAETAASRGVISGYADHTFQPGHGATRAQLAKMLDLAVTGGR